MSPTQPDGYLAQTSSGIGKAVLVLHAWWGLNDTIKAFCDRLAGSGFVAFAPDLYHGKVTDQIDEAGVLASSLSKEGDDQARKQIADSIAFLKQHPGTDESGLAVIGFSLGASYALELCANAPEDMHSVVIFYGAGPTDFSGTKAAFLGHFAANDPYEDKEYVDEIEQAIKDAGHEVTFHHYPDTGHWFFEPDREDAYNEAAAKLAWERTLDFLNRTTS